MGDGAQVRDFLMRVKSRRFPTIEKDLKMVLAHCGSLFLDPAALAEVGPFQKAPACSFDSLLQISWGLDPLSLSATGMHGAPFAFPYFQC